MRLREQCAVYRLVFYRKPGRNYTAEYLFFFFVVCLFLFQHVIKKVDNKPIKDEQGENARIDIVV
jgi:hypothetical protein